MSIHPLSPSPDEAAPSVRSDIGEATKRGEGAALI